MCDQFAIALDVVVFDVVEQPATLTYQHEKASATVVVLLVDLEVLGEVRDTCGKQRNLNLGRTRVGFGQTKRLADAGHGLFFWWKYRIHVISLGFGPSLVCRAKQSDLCPTRTPERSPTLLWTRLG